MLTTLVLIYAPLAPLIIPLGAMAFAMFYCGARYTVLCTGLVSIETGGRLYLRALQHLCVAMYTGALCLGGLLVLNFVHTRSIHSLLQTLLTLAVLFHEFSFSYRLSSLYGPLLEHAAILKKARGGKDS